MNIRGTRAQYLSGRVPRSAVTTGTRYWQLCNEKAIKATVLAVYLVNHQGTRVRGLALKGPVSHDTAKCFAFRRHRYTKRGAVFERCLQCCRNLACCDSYRRSAMPQNDDVHSWQIASGICYRPIVRSDSVGMDARP